MPFIAPVIEAVVAISATVSAVWAAAGVIGQAVIMAGIGIASSYLISALTPKPQSGGNLPGGVNFQTEYGTDVPRQVACGLVGIAGHDTYMNTFGSSNNVMQQVFTLSDYYATELTRLAINGQYVTLGAPDGDGWQQVTSGPLAGNASTGIPLCIVKFFDGRQTVVDTKLTDGANPSAKWPSTTVGFGIAAVGVQLGFDSNLNSSVPSFFFEFKGAPLYDPRKDDTVGGSGAHRWGDVTTHEYSANPILIEYNYRRGFSVNDDLFCGMDMPASDLPVDKFIAGASVCDEVQTDGFARYECSIMLNCMSSHSDNLQSISLSCGSMQIDGVDGSWPLVGTDQSVAITFTDDDIISIADFKYTAKQSMSSLVNSVSGNYPEPEQQWSMIGYDPQIASAFLTIDRRTRDVAIDFPQVRRLRQADQLASIYLFENRFEITATVTLRPRFRTLEAGDWINWNSARYGLNTFIVTGSQLISLDDPAGPRNVIISLQQRDGAIYDGITPAVPVFASPPGDPVYMSEVVGFALLPISVTGTDGMVRAGIRASWTPIDDVTVTQVDVVYFPTSDPTAAIHKIVDVGTTVAILAEGIVGNTEYRVQTRLITNAPRITVFAAGATVTTDNDLYTLTNFNAGVQYQVTQAIGKQAARIDELEQLVASISANDGSRLWNNKQMIQKQLLSVTGNITASITQTMQVASSATTALAQLETTVSASTGAGAAATIVENSTAIADINTGLVASWSLTLNVSGHISGLKQLNDGTLSTFVIETDVFQVANPAAFGGAAQTVFTLQTVSGVTQMALRGDFVADGTVTARMIIAGGINAVNIIATGSITTASGTIGNLAIKTLSIADNAVTVPQFSTAVSNFVSGSGGVFSLADQITFSIDTTGLTGKTINILVTYTCIPVLGGSTIYNVGLVNGSLVTDPVLMQTANPTVATATITLTGTVSFVASGGIDTKTVSVFGESSAAGFLTLLSGRNLWGVACKR